MELFLKNQPFCTNCQVEVSDCFSCSCANCGMGKYRKTETGYCKKCKCSCYFLENPSLFELFTLRNKILTFLIYLKHNLIKLIVIGYILIKYDRFYNKCQYF